MVLGEGCLCGGAIFRRNAVNILTKICVIFAVLAMCVTPLFAANDMCDLANDVAIKGMQKWHSSKKDGLKLMIKAQRLCPDNAALNYNLGMAYLQYGSVDEASSWLLKAVKLDSSHAEWLNNAAGVLLQNGSHNSKALKLAEKASALQPGDAVVLDTLARAQFAAGKQLSALKTARRAALADGADKQIKGGYTTLRDRYINGQLRAIKAGNIDKGLHGLAQLSNDAKAVRVYGQALAQLQRTDEALAVLSTAQSRFAGDSKVRDAYKTVMAQKVRVFYQQYQGGDVNGALAASRRFAAMYPNSSQAQKAFDDLFEAFTGDTATIEIPAARVARVSTKSTADSTALLAGIGGGNNAANGSAEPINLQVDVDNHIPTGKNHRPDAIAVVIGNRHYQKFKHGLPDVNFADRDALIMGKYLVNLMGYKKENILTYMDATGADLRTVFGDGVHPGKLQDYVRKGKSEVFIYYVGHGAPAQQGEAYLVPVNADVDYIANTGYPLGKLYNMIEKMGAKHTTVVLDACFSGDSMAGMLVKNMSPAMLKNVSPTRRVSDSVIFSGADKDQVATWYPQKRHSTFTYYFLKGISGAADVDKNKQITVAELSRYLKDEVSYIAKRQSSRKQNPKVVGDPDSVMVML